VVHINHYTDAANYSDAPRAKRGASRQLKNDILNKLRALEYVN